MKKTIICTAALLISSLVSLLQTAGAHHSFAMFDNSQEKLIEGRVIRWNFNNPHTWLYIEAVDEAGNMQTWGFEGAAMIHAMRQGVNGNTFQEGETVRVIMLPLRSGEPAGAMCFVQKEDGSIARPNDGVCNAESRVAAWQENGWLETAGHLDVFQVK